MIEKDFYSLRYKSAKQVIMAKAKNSDKLPKMWIEQLVTGDYNGFSFPIVFQQQEGYKKYDILPTYTSSLLLFSERILSIFRQEGFIGWQTFPINLLDKQGEEIFGYSGFSVLGRSDAPNYSKSELIERANPYVVGGVERIYKGLYINIDTWDKSDFFIPKGTTKIVVSSRVFNIIQKSKLTNVSCSSLLNWEIPDFGMKIIRSKEV